MTRFALPVKCGCLGASGFKSATASSAIRSRMIPGSRMEPHIRERTICLRVHPQLELLININEFVAAEEHPHIARQRGTRLLVSRQCCALHGLAAFAQILLVLSNPLRL